MQYEDWLEAQKMTDDAEARRLYAERDSGIGHPYHTWRERYGYSDTATARADYAEYKKQLEILTPKKRGPGRPATGNAMTPAEKQRAYRERRQAREGAELQELQQKLIKAEARIMELETELAARPR